MTIELSENVIDAIALAVKTGVVKKIQEPKTEQWQELKETITELRDNDGTGTQQEVCKFLANYMDVLEKQMEQPCEDCVSRHAVLDMLEDINAETNGVGFYYKHYVEYIKNLSSVQPQPKIGHWIEEEIRNGYIVNYKTICSNCGISNVSVYKNYCPNCGAEMEV